MAASGKLDPTPGGPHPFKPEWEWRYSQHNPFVGDFPTDKRSVYLMQQRIRMQPYLGTFDGADTNAVTGLRRTDTPPQQALFMMNSDFMHKQAGILAERVMKEALARVSDGTDRVHVSFDLDAVDPEVAPGVGTPVKGGLDYREAHLLMEILSDSGLMTSLEVVEANPILDVRNASATFAVELVQSAFGKRIL